MGCCKSHIAYNTKVDSYRAEEYLIDVDGSSAVYSDDFFMSVSLTFFVVLSDPSIDIDFNKESRYSSSSVFAISSSDYLLNNLSSSDTS